MTTLTAVSEFKLPGHHIFHVKDENLPFLLGEVVKLSWKDAVREVVVVGLMTHPKTTDGLIGIMVHDVVHLSSLSSQPAVRIDCTQTESTPKFGADDVAPGIFRLEDDRVYTFDVDKVTCTACKGIKS